MAAYARDMNFFSRPDTRTQAVDWIEQNVPTGSFILREWNTPAIEQITPNYRVHFTGFMFEEATLGQWEKRGVKLIVTSDERYDFYSAHAAEFRDVLAQYGKLKQDWKLVSAFKPGPTVKGPPLYIYAAP